MTTSVTKKIALATMSAPLLAALAIGLAGTSAATPAGSQPSGPGSTMPTDADTNDSADRHEGTRPVRHLPSRRPGVHLGTPRHPVRAAAGPAGGVGLDDPATGPATVTRLPHRPGTPRTLGADCINCGPGTYEPGTAGPPPPGSPTYPGADVARSEWVFIYTDQDGAGYWYEDGGVPECIGPSCYES